MSSMIPYFKSATLDERFKTENLPSIQRLWTGKMKEEHATNTQNGKKWFEPDSGVVGYLANEYREKRYSFEDLDKCLRDMIVDYLQDTMDDLAKGDEEHERLLIKRFGRNEWVKQYIDRSKS